MSLARADAEPVFRCAYRLEQVSQDVRTAAARTAGAFPDDWRGDAGIAYQQRLDTTADRVRRVAAAYEAAGVALLPYARALLESQELAWRAESLFAQAAEAAQRSAVAAKLGRVDGLADPGPAEALRAAASRLQAEAIEVERRAAAICAAALEDEASHAPATSRWRSVDRFVGDVARVGVDTVAGTASLLGSAWHALPGVGDRYSRHEARDELLEGAKAAAAVWNIPIDIAHAVQDDRSGLAAGAVASAFGPGRLSKFDQSLLREIARADAAFRDADVRARIATTVARPVSARDLTSNGFDPLNEEARGGHTLSEHVARPLPYLQYRNERGFEVASSFVDERSADRLVNAVLEFHPDEVASLYSAGGPQKVVLHATFEQVTGYYTRDGSAATFPAHGVLVVVVLKEGEPHVRTAFPTR